MNKPSSGASSDYAYLDAKNASFYYGYEHSICDECGNKNKGEFCEDHPDADRQWCFVATFDGKEIVIPHNKLGTNDMFTVTENMLTGIGWILAKYNLVLNKNP